MVKDRLREDLGDLAGLAESIQKFGLIHPIVIDDKGVLVAGERRLLVCKQLGMRRIDVRKYGTLSAAERREIELEENLHRKDLTPFERSKTVQELVETAKKVATKTAGTPRSNKGGRGKSTPTSTRAVAERVGIPDKTIRDAETHVAAAEKYPLLQGDDWSQKRAVETAKTLDALPAKDCRDVIQLAEHFRRAGGKQR